MNPYLQKEIRLLLPSWVAVLILVIVSPWLAGHDRDSVLNATPLFVFFGLILLSVDSFGREFSLGTFSTLLSQPISRRQIWWTKISLLLTAAMLVLLGYFLSCACLVPHVLNHLGLEEHADKLRQNFHHALLNGAIAAILALAGGLWATVLIRQISAAFWVAFLAPLTALMLVALVTPGDTAKNPHITLGLYALAIVYGITGFGWAHYLFHRAQDVAWNGGIVDFSRWRYWESRPGALAVRRCRRPVRALLHKEIRLQGISLLCAGIMLAMHLSILLMRVFYGRYHPNSIPDNISDFFWVFWLVLPLVIGCMAVAEERKLGVVESQFCLSISRRTQFLTKFIPTLLAGVFLGGTVPVFLEGLAAWLGFPNNFFKPGNSGEIDFLPPFEFFCGTMISLSAGLTLLGIFASSLARNFLQTLGIAIVLAVAAFFFIAFFTAPINPNQPYQIIHVGAKVWGPLLPVLLGPLVVITLIPWLSYRNFAYFNEGRRVWLRNLLGPLAAFVFVFGGSALIYHRIWELLVPLEPAHGPAVISLSQRPQFEISQGLKVQLPDGRVWLDNLTDRNQLNWQYGINVQLSSFGELSASRWRLVYQELFPPLPFSLGPQQFLPGSNWVSTSMATPLYDFYQTTHAVGYSDVAGIKADGTLWIPAQSKPYTWTGSRMVRYGYDTNWLQVLDCSSGLLLLKTDGTLWQWPTYTSSLLGYGQFSWPRQRVNQPIRSGTGSDWCQLCKRQDAIPYAQKKDGSIWILHDPPSTNMDKAFSSVADFNLSEHTLRGAYVQTNGTLWLANGIIPTPRLEIRLLNDFSQFGTGTNWVAAVDDCFRAVALKSDGSLWSWKSAFYNSGGPGEQDDISEQLLAPNRFDGPPTRFGTHNDWVGVASVGTGIVSLAADGSLWLWPEPAVYESPLVKASRRPKFLANIFNPQLNSAIPFVTPPKGIRLSTY